MMNPEYWVIIIGCMVAIPCSILGCFLVLRKSVMVSDAIAHSVLPGIVIAYLITESRDSFAMFIGASLFGILTTFLIEMISQKSSIQKDASIGIVYTLLFSIGVILISLNSVNIDMDPEHILYGEILLTPFNQWYTDSGLCLGPKSIWTLGIINIIVIGTISMFFRYFSITSFDSKYATSIGISAIVWHYSLMSLVSFTTIGAFDSVGAILVIAFIAIPSTTAHLLTKSLKKMILLSIIIGVTAVIIGLKINILINSSASGSITVAMLGIFLAVFLYTSYIKKNLL